MPITLVTGLPGHGKTLYSLFRWKGEAEKAQPMRPVFHNSIPGLAIPNWQTFEVEKWQDCPAGSILVIDEAQFAFPVTGRGQTPEWVQKLATHRHLGLDLVVITQDPMLLDNFVRRLVDRHFHVVRKFGTKFATVYEYVNGVKQDVSKSRGSDGIRHEWRYPKEVFGWYKSAEVHTVKARLPARFWLLCSIPFIFGGLVYFGYQRLKPSAVAERHSTQKVTSEDAPAGVVPVHAGGTQGAPTGAAGPVMTTGEYLAAHMPRVPGLAYTAPVYDNVTSPQQAPYPAACIASAKRCQCYSQQGTRLDMAAQLCRQIADGGFFVAWNAVGERVQRSEEPRPAASLDARQNSGQVAGSFGSPAPRLLPLLRLTRMPGAFRAASGGPPSEAQGMGPASGPI